ncbi:MAG: helix-turn-helix domain-containing protein [Verrucomicrobia bacterium]|nr:helix-turn-helix domain-containing protein [Verrucomicrobiota bacterium]
MSIATQEIRRRAIEAYNNGKGTQAEIAHSYNVDIRTFQRWLFCYRESGRTAPLTRGHRPASFSGDSLDHLDHLIEGNPDATFEELRIMTGTKASIMSVKRAADRLGYRFKKNAARQRTRT